MVQPPKKFCSVDCFRSRPTPPKPCVECGRDVREGRGVSGYVTCSDECANVRRERTVEATRSHASKPCEVCGKEMRGPPSTLANRRTCGPDCLAKWKAQHHAPKVRPCVVCEKPHPLKRSTCSEACRAEFVAKMVRESSTVGARSEAVRARRRRHAANAYRGKDKAAVIARLTKEQRGKCKVCGCEGTPLGNGKVGLVLDHCHATGVPRALLCGPCNAALGLLGESPARIAALHRYALSWAQPALVAV